MCHAPPRCWRTAVVCQHPHHRIGWWIDWGVTITVREEEQQVRLERFLMDIVKHRPEVRSASSFDFPSMIRCGNSGVCEYLNIMDINITLDDCQLESSKRAHQRDEFSKEKLQIALRTSACIKSDHSLELFITHAGKVQILPVLYLTR